MPILRTQTGSSEGEKAAQGERTQEEEKVLREIDDSLTTTRGHLQFQDSFVD